MSLLRRSTSSANVGPSDPSLPSPYASRKGLRLGYVYELLRVGKVPFVEKEKVVKRIPRYESLTHLKALRAISSP